MMQNSQLRRSGYATSGAAPNAPAAMGGGMVGVGGQANVSTDVGTGQLSLGLLGAMVLGAIGFYIWTRSVQGS